MFPAMLREERGWRDDARHARLNSRTPTTILRGEMEYRCTGEGAIPALRGADVNIPAAQPALHILTFDRVVLHNWAARYLVFAFDSIWRIAAG